MVIGQAIISKNKKSIDMTSSIEDLSINYLYQRKNYVLLVKEL